MKIDFNDFELSDSLKNRLNEIGFNSPTEVQSKVIPLSLKGIDILASSKTGSGKTGAFVIPMIARIINGDTNSALILSPTRELAMQIKDAIHNIRGNEKINTALIFGGSDIKRQIDALKKKPNVIIATPGRLNDHIKRKTIILSHCNMLILDEFDRMLEMGFKEEIKTIIAQLPKNRQTLMFSATTRQSIKNLAKEYLINHQEVILANAHEDHKNIKQEFIQVLRNDKYSTLVKHITEQQETTIVFVSTKRMADDLSYNLKNEGHLAIAIHGDLRQREREKAIKDFRNNKYQILVATDVVARGLDVPHVKIIINYDMPKSPEDYTHRIGRTGRGEAQGISISFVTSADRRIHQAIVTKSNSDAFDSDFKKPQREKRNLHSRDNKKPYNRYKSSNNRGDNQQSNNRDNKKPYNKDNKKKFR